MSEPRRATVMLIQRGDPEIGGALMAGVIAGRAEALKDAPGVEERRGTSSDTADAVPPDARGLAKAYGPPRGEGFWEADAQPVESLEIYTVEQDKWRRVARQVRVAVGNTRTAEDYRQLIVKARGDYADHSRPGPLHTAAGKLLLAWAMLCEAMRKAYRTQDRVLKP